MKVSRTIYGRIFWFLTILLMPQASQADIYRPTTAATLVSAVAAANASSVDDVIDLEGNIIVFDVPVASTFNALPVIISAGMGGRLEIINGGIERSVVVDTVPFRFLTIDGGAQVSLFNLTFINGFSYNGTCTTGVDLNCEGGAIFNSGTLTIENSVFAYNVSYYSGGAIFNDTGAALSITSSDFNNNFAQNSTHRHGGGAIINWGTIETITNTTIDSNFAAGSGAGIYNVGSLHNLFASTLSNNNSTEGNGGAIYNDPDAAVLQITNSTISGNEALLGGGIYLDGTIVERHIKDAIPNETSGIFINNCTISANAATSTGSIRINLYGGGGIYNAAESTITLLTSNIIANNTDAGIPGAPDVYDIGTIVTEGYNLIGSSLGNAFINGANYDFVGYSANLGPLQNNGGFTYTMELLPNSIAINAGYNIYSLLYDQRGSPFARVKCGVPDMGAFERQACY